MKVYKEPTWQLETTGSDRNTALFGVKIFDYEWVNTGKKAKIVNSSDDTVNYLTVYSVVIDKKEHQFACDEYRNGVYNFYVYKY